MRDSRRGKHLYRVSVGRTMRFLVLLYFLCLVVSCVVLPGFHKEAEEESGNLPDFQNTASAPGTERVLAIDDNEEALLWRLRMMEEAQEEIILTTFDFGADEAGREIMAALLHAAERGVKVKILTDGINGFLKLDGSRDFKALVSSPNVEARIYNPVNLLKPWRLNYRMHDKYIIIDERLYLLGGRNTNGLFLGPGDKNQNIDRDILVYETAPGADTSLCQVREYFDSVWSLSVCREYRSSGSGRRISEAGKELRDLYEELRQREPEAFSKTDWERETLAAESVALLTNPVQAENKPPRLWKSVCQIMESGTDIVIQTPYVVCCRAMYRDLASLCGEERQLRIVTNAVENGANPWGCVDYLNEKENLLETGAEIYEYLGGLSLHTKTILVDSHISIVGSFNTDMRSAYLDTETMLVIDCPKLNLQLRESVEETMTYCKHVMPDGSETAGSRYEETELSLGKRIIYGILRQVLVPFRHLL